MASKKIQLYTDRANTIEASPETSANCVILSDGNDLQKVLDNDLTNPTVVHEETSFKVGAGDIDVSSSVVDGEVGRMVIKGKTYQNILPEPSTHVLTNNKEMFKVNEGLDPNVEIVDGVSKSAILSGQTKYMYQGVVQDTFAHVVKFVSGQYLHPQTGQLTDGQSTHVNCDQYFEIPSGATTIVNKGNNTYKKLCLYDSDKNYIVGDGKADGGNSTSDIVRQIPSNARYFRFSTSKDSTKDERCYIYIDGVLVATSDVDIERALISCKMPVLQTVGKNLFDGELEVGSLSTNTGDVESDSSFKRTVNFIRINPNKEYRMRANGTVNGRVYFYDINKSYISTQLNESRLVVPSNAKYLKFRIGIDILSGGQEIQLEEGSAPTSYEPHKTNTLHAPEEVVLRSLPNGVCDTLNCMTGEYVQHIKEVVFDGSSDESIGMVNVNDTTLVRFNINNVAGVQTGNANKVLCSSLPYLYIHGLSGGSATVSQECISNHSQDANVINIVIKRSRLSSVDVAGFRAYLQSNPITIQYSIATPVVKTVDLSTSGNWEKIVLDGSESWTYETPYLRFYTPAPNMVKTNNYLGKLFCDNPNFILTTNYSGMKDLGEMVLTGYIDANNSYPNENWIYITVKSATDVNELKQYLSQNPITVWYQTATHQDSTQVKQPIFFAEGHIIQSSGADNSLIPTLDYQAKTSNSYVMDLMKTNTRYTMKAKSASGTFTIDGTSYGAGTNGTFTTPTSMTNKLLVMSNKTNTEVMILEGDVTDKTIPYFKGIKSAFEDEGKIEVLSTGKNLFDVNLIYGAHTYGNVGLKPTHGTGYARVTNETGDYILVKPNTKYTFSIGNNFSFAIAQLDKDGISLGDTGWLNNKSSWTITTQSTARYVGFNIRKLDDSDIVPDEVYKAHPMFEESLSATTHEPCKSNTTKIPLLSPLRSLPNGVCDELIIDRMKKKATLIQRVGVGVLDGTQYISTNPSNVDTNLYQPFYCGDVFGNMAIAPHNVVTVRCDNLLACSSSTGYRNLTVNAMYQYTDSSARLAGQITKKDLGAKNVRQWFEANPTTVYYQLATPVVTEIDLENFPFVYKDGHIFLNSEIAPVVEIDYSINQSQQIQSNNETLQRHELDILDLDNLIVSFVNAEYNLRLLKFDMELSMMTLAE